MSGNGSQIWKGFSGTLVPWPFRAYHAKHYIQPGQQAVDDKVEQPKGYPKAGEKLDK